MVRYVLWRLAQAVLVLFAVSVLAFAIVRLVPGDPALLILGPQNATPERVAELNHQLGLDQSLVDQYGDFIGGVFALDPGESIRSGRSVAELIVPRLGPSVLLLVYACLITALVVVPLGIIAAVRRNRPADHFIRLGGTISYAMPAFLTGLLLVLIFSVSLGLFPVEGYGEGFFGHIHSLTLPAITVALSIAPALMRTLRSGMIETLSQDFIEAARARGFSNRRVLVKHALTNSVLPTITVLGLSVGWLLSSAVIVEVVFSIPGLGTLLVSSVSDRDYPVIQGLIMIFATAVVLSSLVTDLVYRMIDPRIRL